MGTCSGSTKSPTSLRADRMRPQSIDEHIAALPSKGMERSGRAGSTRLVEDRGDGSSDGGPLQPELQPLRVLLGQNPLADGVGHREASSPQNGQQGTRRPLGDVLLREITLVFVALHLRLQRAASRIVQSIVYEVVVEPAPVVVELMDRGYDRVGDRLPLLGLAVRQRGKHPELGAAGRLARVRHYRNGGAAQYRGAQDEAGDSGLDRLRAPPGDGRLRRHDQEGRRAAMDSPRHRHVGGPTETLSGVGRQLDLDDDYPDGSSVAEKENDDISPVFGGLGLGQVGGGDAGLGVVRKREAEHLDEDLGGQRRSVFEEIHQDLVGHGGHKGRGLVVSLVDLIPYRRKREGGGREADASLIGCRGCPETARFRGGSTMAPTRANGKICYLEIPTADMPRSVRFYQEVFGWQVRQRGDGATAFDDGAGEVSGAWVTGRPSSPVPGLLLYIMVDSIATTVEAVTAHGGQIVQPLGVDAPELTARFADPDGNVLGLYQEPNQPAG